MQRRSSPVLAPLALAAFLAMQAPVSAQAPSSVPGASNHLTPTAEPRPQAVEIPAQPALQALQAFVRQYNFQLLYAPDLLRGLTSKPVSGTLGPREALARLLDGSGVQVVDTGPASATLRLASAPRSGAGGGQPQSPADKASDGDKAERGGAGGPANAPAASAPRQRFDLPAGDALEMVRRIAAQTGASIQFKDDDLRGVRTNAIAGDYTVHQALQSLLADTRLWFGTAVASGVISVNRVETIPKVEVTGSHLRTMVNEQSANPMVVLTRSEIERSGVTTLAELRNLVPQLSQGAAASFDGNSSGGSPDGRVLFNLRGLQAGNSLVLVDGLRLPRTGSRTVAEAYEATGIPMSAIERVEVLLGGGSAIYGADAVGGVVNIITRKRYQGTEVEYARENTFDTDAANDRLSISHALRRGALSLRAMAQVETQNALAMRDRDWLASDDRRPYGGSDRTANNYPVGGMITAASGLLPGLGTRTAYIPAGSAGKNLTVQDYANATATPRYDAARFQNAVNPYRRDAASVFAEYEFNPGANVYANLSWSRNQSEGPGSPLTITNLRLPAGYPGNPFGVPILVSKYLWELGTPDRHYSFTQRSMSAGVRGELPWDWRYNLSWSDARSNPSLPDGAVYFDTTRLNAAVAGGTPPVVLHDSQALLGQPGSGPNAEGTWEALLAKDGRHDRPLTRSHQLQLDGPIWQLQSGPVNLAVGVERRVDAIRLSSDQPQSGEASQPDRDRVVTAQYLEMSLPLISPKSGFTLPLVHSLTLSGALRHDRYNDFGGATTPLTGLMFKPTSWLALRATRNKAFRVPSLIDITRSRYTTTLTVPATGVNALIDPYRKNEAYVGALRTTLGGNPALKPERSEHLNFGLVFDSPFDWAKGFSLSVDRWSSDILDRVGAITRQERMLYFPETFLREALTPEDQAAGYQAGRITGMDSTSMNIARFRSAGWDYAMRYTTRTSLGEFSLSVKQTRSDRYEAFATPNAARNPYTGPALRPTRTVGLFTWAYRGAGASVTVLHQKGFPVNLVPPVAHYGDTLQFNTNLWYDFGAGSWHDKDSTLGRLMHDTRVSFGLINAADEMPALSSAGDVNSSVDPRLRRYTFTLRKRF